MDLSPFIAIPISADIHITLAFMDMLSLTHIVKVPFATNQ